MKESAQKYLKYGFNPIPVNQDKTPACDWKHWQKNKMSEIGLFTTDSIALICGHISDNLEVLDFDNHQNTAKENLTKYLGQELVKEIYEKYKLPVISTPSGGFHIYYRCDEIGTNMKLASVLVYNEKVKRKLPDAIIETRGVGGYVVAIPTSGYKLIRNDYKDLQFITKEERSILIEVAKTFDESGTGTKKYKHKVDDESPGNIYNNTPESIDDAKELLKSIGWEDLGFNNSWRRPGKNKGISATFGNIAPNIFYSFSPNVEYFEYRTCYTPFQIIGLIKYNGDFSKFASDLAKRYNLNSKSKEPEQKESNNDLIVKLETKALLDWSKEYPQPRFICRLKTPTEWHNLMSLGNFSCFTGKSKSRKSFARFFIEAGAISNKTIQDKFIIKLPEGKQNVVCFDTEQGINKVFRNAYSIVKMAQIQSLNHYKVYALRDFNYLDRCKIIEHVLNETNNLGFVFIDGVADLAFGNNDEQEANRVVQLLMTWTASFDIHINTVIHQPKGADWATGHLGSAIEKKAETVINIKKDGSYSIFEPKQLRESDDFEPFPFLINDGLPEIITDETKINEIFEDEI
jgi:hypothetical protein